MSILFLGLISNLVFFQSVSFAVSREDSKIRLSRIMVWISLVDSHFDSGIFVVSILWLSISGLRVSLFAALCLDI